MVWPTNVQVILDPQFGINDTTSEGEGHGKVGPPPQSGSKFGKNIREKDGKKHLQGQNLKEQD